MNYTVTESERERRKTEGARQFYRLSEEEQMRRITAMKDARKRSLETTKVLRQWATEQGFIVGNELVKPLPNLI